MSKDYTLSRTFDLMRGFVPNWKRILIEELLRTQQATRRGFKRPMGFQISDHPCDTVLIFVKRHIFLFAENMGPSRFLVV